MFHKEEGGLLGGRELKGVIGNQKELEADSPVDVLKYMVFNLNITFVRFLISYKQSLISNTFN